MTNRFENRYLTGDLPWDIQRPDFNLVNTLEKSGIKPCPVLDIGCGTGDNALWLAGKGFRTTGVDFSPTAIELARKKAAGSHLEIDFYAADILHDKISGGPFGFVFDRGCFHTFDKKSERRKFAKNVYQLLGRDGQWISLIGNYDDGRLDVGPPKRKASEIIEAVEPYFEILSMNQGRFDSNDPVPSKIWICRMQKRDG